LRIIYGPTDRRIHVKGNDNFFSRIDIGRITANENKGENNIYKSVNSNSNEIIRRAIYKNTETVKARRGRTVTSTIIRTDNDQMKKKEKKNHRKIQR